MKLKTFQIKNIFLIIFEYKEKESNDMKSKTCIWMKDCAVGSRGIVSISSASVFSSGINAFISIVRSYSRVTSKQWDNRRLNAKVVFTKSMFPVVSVIAASTGSSIWGHFFWMRSERESEPSSAGIPFKNQ